ncbi:MAG: 4Fe-4S cluster-binding domain-containing protein [bacterium]|nr:4Fe-4S cluster-binding domain-containing protein [bacterium]
MSYIFTARGIKDDRLNERLAVARIFPFKATEHVLSLINWDNYKTDPIFHLIFPQPEMLSKEELDQILNTPENELPEVINKIRLTKNPNPAGQEFNRPVLELEDHEEIVDGIQHKYEQTVLVFPERGQNCFAFCSYCFRAPQFWGGENKFSERTPERMISYLTQHKEVTDVLFTGGDPLTMKASELEKFIIPLLENPELSHIQNIRIGTKALTFYPQLFLNDPDTDKLFSLLEKITSAEKHVTVMAHFSNPNELKHPDTIKAVKKIKSYGISIRSQAPTMRNINDSADIWAEMWQLQVKLGIIPYYMFITRDTGPKDYFEVPLAEAYNIYIKAREKVSGLGHTVRGPSMSCSPGKICVMGIETLNNEKVFILKFLQARNPEWQERVFFAEYDPNAHWISDLKPAFGEKEFFFETELKEIYDKKKEEFSHSLIINLSFG